MSTKTAAPKTLRKPNQTNGIQRIIKKLRVLQAAETRAKLDLLLKRVALGEQLLELKRLAGHGGWSDACRQAGFLERTAQRLIKFAGSKLAAEIRTNGSDLAERLPLDLQTLLLLDTLPHAQRTTVLQTSDGDDLRRAIRNTVAEQEPKTPDDPADAEPPERPAQSERMAARTLASQPPAASLLRRAPEYPRSVLPVGSAARPVADNTPGILPRTAVGDRAITQELINRCETLTDELVNGACRAIASGELDPTLRQQALDVLQRTHALLGRGVANARGRSGQLRHHL